MVIDASFDMIKVGRTAGVNHPIPAEVKRDLPLCPIGAKIALAWTETCAFVVAHASDIARHGD
ncbi:hypothetical protein, partial [Mesorhizobium sp. M0676]|uniref:hypothetical protein n=1 Tax=Mesorhizobium sp. M0676 TaxID=2956984 RepID=UPI0033381131